MAWPLSWRKSTQKVLYVSNVAFWDKRGVSCLAFELTQAKVSAEKKKKTTIQNIFNSVVKQQYKHMFIIPSLFWEQLRLSVTRCTAATTIWANLLEIREEWRFFEHVSCYLSGKGQDTLIWKSIIFEMPNLYWHFSRLRSPSHFGTILCHEEPLND